MRGLQIQRRRTPHIHPLNTYYAAVRASIAPALPERWINCPRDIISLLMRLSFHSINPPASLRIYMDSTFRPPAHKEVFREVRQANSAPSTIVHHCPPPPRRVRKDGFSRLEKKIQKSLGVLLPICYKVLCETKCVSQERGFSGFDRAPASNNPAAPVVVSRRTRDGRG